MVLYTILEAVVGFVIGLWMAICTKKAEGVTYGKLDRAGRITNIILIPVYAVTAPFCMAIGMICRPQYGGLLAILGWIVSVLAASAAFFCWLGLGASVALRKQGKSKKSFAVQFAGFGGIALMLLIFCVFYGNLLAPLN